jgi:hypothetical protein
VVAVLEHLKLAHRMSVGDSGAAVPSVWGHILSHLSFTRGCTPATTSVCGYSKHSVCIHGFPVCALHGVVTPHERGLLRFQNHRNRVCRLRLQKGETAGVNEGQYKKHPGGGTGNSSSRMCMVCVTLALRTYACLVNAMRASAHDLRPLFIMGSVCGQYGGDNVQEILLGLYLPNAFMEASCDHWLYQSVSRHTVPA